MTFIPWCAHSYCDDNMAWGRWDQLWLGRVLAGVEGRPPGAYEFYESTFDDVLSYGGVLVLPVGHYHDHGEKHRILQQLARDFEAMPWGVVFATSDEANTFEWHKIDPWPDHIQLYVQLPRVDHTYPPGTRFYGEGSPVSVQDIQGWAIFTRDVDVFLMGQGGHERRERAFDALHQYELTTDRDVAILETDGFTLGRDQESYLHAMTRSWVTPAPSGICSQSSFRLFEALEAGCIPIADGLRPGGVGAGYWELVGMGDFLPVIDDWSMVGDMIDDLLVDREFRAAKISSGWQRYKRDFVRTLHDDVWERYGEGRPPEGPHDQITVIVPTSPVPSNPSLDMIQEVIASIRADLPGAEILICCDGVRDEQADRAADYHSFLHNLCIWTLTQHNVTPFVFGEHLHQSGMLRAILSEIHTDYLLYVEHDCPIVAPVPWADLLATMSRGFNGLNLIRLMHEADVLPEHANLFIQPEEPLDRHVGAPWIPTVQWSQRPHLARVGWYSDLVDSYFGANARTMVEDVMHGVVQHGWTFTDGIPTQEMWDHWSEWRMAVYAPDGNMKRSGHLDGREGGPKFPMLVAYDNGRPIGAPREGWIE